MINSAKNFADLKTNVTDKIQDTSAQMKTRVGRYINTRYRDVLKRIKYDPVRLDYSFTTTAGTQDYIMPDDFENELSVYDSTNKVALPPIGLQKWIDDYQSSLTTQDAPVSYLIYLDTVNTQISATGTISVVSSSTSDTSQKVRVKGIVSSVEDTEQFSLNGTTTVTGTKSFSRAITVSLDTTCTGKITITRGSDTLAVIRPGDKVSRYKKLRLVRVPAGVYTIEVRYKIAILPLINDEDYTLIEVSDILEAGAEADAWRYKRQFGKAADIEFLYKEKLDEYLFDEATKPNQINFTDPKPFNPENLY